MKPYRLKGISKRYAAKAAMYRRYAKSQGGLGALRFTQVELLELFNYESHGIGSVDKKTNGFAYGKWVRDLTVSMMIEDIRNGDMCKIEFLGTAIQRIHNKTVLSSVPAGTFFPHLKVNT